MPMRTELPTISITWTTTSSPSMIFSPGFLVMMSTVASPPWKARLERWVRLGRLDGAGLGEQRGPDGSVRRLVDDLVATALPDNNRRAAVATEVRRLADGADGDPDVDLRGVLGAHPGGVRVGEVDAVVAVVQPRVRDRERDVGVVDGVQPGERRVRVRGDERVARPPEPDQARRELDHGVAVDLERAEAGAVEREGHGKGISLGGSDQRRKSSSEAWTMLAPALSADW